MSSTGTRKCYVCKQAGHQSKDCPQAAGAAKPPVAAKPEPVESTSSSSSSSSSGTRKCYICKQAGHTSKECPQATAQDKARSSSSSSSSSKSSEEKTDFKARLADYKAQVAADPTAPKPLFCYLCGVIGHRERDCPRNSKKDEDKTCLKCGDPSHIARYCPTISNRTVYRQETKDRSKECYVCGKEGHHATECPDLDVLAEEFPKFVAKLQSGMKLNVKVYNILLEKCARALELNGALYLYQQMKERNVEPNADTMKHLQYLYDRGAKDQSRLTDIPKLKKRVGMLREIVTSVRHEQKTEEIKDSVLGHLIAYLRQPEARAAAEKCASLFDLAKHLKKVSTDNAIKGLSEPFSSQSARTVLATMKSLGRYHQKSKSCEFDLEGDLDQPGKFMKKENGEKGTSKKKKKGKKSSSSKKKNSTATDSDGDAVMSEDDAAGKKKNSKKRKATEESAKDNGDDGDDDSKPVEKKSKKSEKSKSKEPLSSSSSSSTKSKSTKSKA